jgi:phage tail-like protein
MSSSSLALKNPHTSLRFKLEMDSIIVGSFSEITMADVTFDVVEYRAGDYLPTMQKQAGLYKNANVVLKRGVFMDQNDLFAWIQRLKDGEFEQAVVKNFSIILMDQASNPAAQWDFVNGWPVKYTAPPLNAKGTEIAIETLEVAHEGVKRVKPGQSHT